MVTETVSLSYHIWVIGGLVAAIVGMAIYIVKSNSKFEKISKETNIVVTRNNVVIENNTKAHERVFDYILKDSKKRK